MTTLVIALIILACSDQEYDDYKKFAEEGEISYTEKIDSLRSFPGDNRIKLQGVIDADPKIVELRTYWNSKSDSVIIPVTRSLNADTIEFLIEDIPENIYNFELITFDNANNPSLTSNITAAVYGERYQNSLYDRPLLSNKVIESGLMLEYGTIDISTGVIGTQVEYVNNNDQEDTFFVPVDSSLVLLPNFKTGSTFRYSTLFVPEENAIDTFSVVSQEYAPVLTPVLRNAEISYTTTDPSSDSRFRLLQDWTSNEAIKNYSNGQGMGWDANYDGGLFAIQIGHGGTPNSIVNGKIYQTVSSGAADFSLNIRMRAETNHTDILETDAEENRYLFVLVIKGNTELPDLEAVLDGSASEILGVQRITREAGDSYSLDFTVEEAGDITVGVLWNSSDANRYARFEKFEIIAQ